MVQYDRILADDSGIEVSPPEMRCLAARVAPAAVCCSKFEGGCPGQPGCDTTVRLSNSLLVIQ